MILDPYSGPRGWSEGLRTLGLTDIGIELDAAACATAAAAGHRTIRSDVASFPLAHLAGKVDGLIMSPPCQAFSTAGKGEGRDVIPDLIYAVHSGDSTWTHDDDRIRHVLEVGRWAETLRPTWIACEQVPPVLPVWQAYADRWRTFGWSVWAGILNAADYGVPQTRRRAFLIARTDRRPVAPPEPTHCRGGAVTMFGELAPWVTMADALGWGEDDVVLNPGVTPTQPNRRRRPIGEPAPVVAFGHDSANWAWERTHGRVLDRRQQSRGGYRGEPGCRPVPIDELAPTIDSQVGGKWVFRMPATTVAGDPRITARCHHDEGTQGANAVTVEQAMTGDYDGTAPIKLSIRDALTLQGFRPDYPVQGTRTKQFEQVGNAVPPPLAAAVIAAVTGTQIKAAA